MRIKSFLVQIKNYLIIGFLTIAIVVTLISVYTAKIITDPKDFEIFTIAMIADIKNEKYDEFYELLSSKLTKEIIKFNIITFPENEKTLSEDFSFYFNKADLVISPSFTKSISIENFVEIPDEFQKENDEIVDNKHIGAKLYDSKTGEKLNSDFIESYGPLDTYLYIRSTSLHIKDMSDATYSVFKELINR